MGVKMLSRVPEDEAENVQDQDDSGERLGGELDVFNQPISSYVDDE